MKRILALLLAIIVILPTAVFASDDIKIYINDELQNFDTPAEIKDGRTMLPMRDIFERLGASVFWNDKEKSVYAKKDKTEVLLTIGDTKAVVNDKESKLDTAPVISGGRTLVPVRFVAESLGASVNWDDKERRVDINIEDIQLAPQAKHHTVKAVTAIGHDGNKPQNTVDGKEATRWSHEGSESWITFEFYDVVPIDYMGVTWYCGDERMATFEAHTSTDGINYKKVFDGKSPLTLDMAAYDCEDSNAKFVKLICRGNTANLWNSICEVKFYPTHETGEMVVDAPASVSRGEGSKELMEVLAKIDSHFDQEFLDWLAGLYDVESGGFYNSNSARDYPGFYPNIAAGMCAMDMMQNLKLMDEEAKLEGMIPQEFLEGMSNFAIERQNPDDGYFYDPQWGYDVVDTLKNRSLYQAEGLISLVDGAKPKYKTPTERLAEAKKDGQDATDQAAAELNLDPRFVSEESIKKWLNESITPVTYHSANEIAASWASIQAAGLEEPVREHLRAQQNQETGLFGADVNRAALNAAMKAGCAFKTVEAPYPNYQKIIKSVIEIIKKEPSLNATDLWNTVSTLQNVISSNAETITSADLAELDANLAELYETMYEDYKQFFQADGGATGARSGSSDTTLSDPKSQISVGFNYDSNMDGTFLLIRFRNDAYSLAGIPRPQIFTKEQKWYFWNKIRNAKPVVKKTAEELTYSISDDFEGYADDKAILDSWGAILRNGSSATLVNKKMAVRDNDNTALKLSCVTGVHYFYHILFTPENYKTYVAKFDISFAKDAYHKNYLGNGLIYTKTPVCWTVDARGTDTAKINISRTGKDLIPIATLNTNEWYEFEIRYTPTSSERKIEFLIDGKKVYSGNDYWLSTYGDREAPTEINGLGFTSYDRGGGVGDIYLDNVECYFEQ